MTWRGSRWEIVEVTGSGSSVVGVEIYGGSSYGVVRALALRSPLGSTATRVDQLALVHSLDQLATLAAEPPREHVLVYATGIALVASPTVPSLATPLDRPQGFSDGLAAILSVTATAAWSLRLAVQVADLRDPLIGSAV